MLIDSDIPPLLQSIPNPPKSLFVKGDTLDDLLAQPRVAIVGSRKVSAYGRAVTMQLAEELARKGIIIVSGLALGVDAIAHQAALDAGGRTIAILPTSINKIYPASHAGLAHNIVSQGGVLLSEYPDGTDAFPGNFVARNRLVSGISDAVVVTEAAEKSGTLHTARFALAQHKKLLVVPGNITSPLSKGTNQLIQQGATLITSTLDVLNALGMDAATTKSKKPTSNNPKEQIILDLIYSGVNDGSDLQRESQLSPAEFNQTLTMLEIAGDIQNMGSNQWSLT